MVRTRSRLLQLQSLRLVLLKMVLLHGPRRRARTLHTGRAPAAGAEVPAGRAAGRGAARTVQFVSFETEQLQRPRKRERVVNGGATAALRRLRLLLCGVSLLLGVDLLLQVLVVRDINRQSRGRYSPTLVLVLPPGRSRRC